MKYNIYINQKAFAEIAKDLDLTDCAIVNFIQGAYFWEKADKKKIDGKVYIWISYQLVLDQMPLLRIKTKKTLRRRLQRIEEAGIIEKKVVDKSKTYFRITEKAGRTIFNDEGGVGQNRTGGSDKIAQGGRTKSHHYYIHKNNIHKNNKEKNNKKRKKDKNTNGNIRELKKERTESDGAKLMREAIDKKKKENNNKEKCQNQDQEKKKTTTSKDASKS